MRFLLHSFGSETPFHLEEVPILLPKCRDLFLIELGKDVYQWEWFSLTHTAE
jgi:hypothetical protein